MKKAPHLFFAGQMTGVEGYVESAASGMVAGINAARAFLSLEELVFTRESVIGALAFHVSDGENTVFQPMNANFGILASFDTKIKGGKRGRKEAYARRSLDLIQHYRKELPPLD